MPWGAGKGTPSGPLTSNAPPFFRLIERVTNRVPTEGCERSRKISPFVEPRRMAFGLTPWPVRAMRIASMAEVFPEPFGPAKTAPPGGTSSFSSLR